MASAFISGGTSIITLYPDSNLPARTYKAWMMIHGLMAESTWIAFLFGLITHRLSFFLTRSLFWKQNVISPK